jgi:DNA-binding transcriptional MerR regulator
MAADRGADAVTDGLRGIQQVAAELGVTPRAVRFYEDKGLVEPQRVGTTRVYTRREFARMQLILRGKRLGFSLRDIKQFLDLYDADEVHLEQTRHLLEQVNRRVRALHAQRRAIDETLAELKEIEKSAFERLQANDAP